MAVTGKDTTRWEKYIYFYSRSTFRSPFVVNLVQKILPWIFGQQRAGFFHVQLCCILLKQLLLMLGVARCKRKLRLLCVCTISSWAVICCPLLHNARGLEVKPPWSLSSVDLKVKLHELWLKKMVLCRTTWKSRNQEEACHRDKGPL